MTKKSELSLMGQMKREAERDFHKFIKYVAELEKENKELKEYWKIEINTCNRYREKCTELEKNYVKALQKIAELDKENTELSKKLGIQYLQKE